MLKEGGVRVEVDLRDEKMNAKIRDAELVKIPYMVVVGPREAEAGLVAPRRKGQGQLEPMSREAFLERVQPRDARAHVVTRRPDRGVAPPDARRVRRQREARVRVLLERGDGPAVGLRGLAAPGLASCRPPVDCRLT